MGSSIRNLREKNSSYLYSIRFQDRTMDLAEGQGGNDASQTAEQSTHAQCEKNSGPETESRGADREMYKSAENRNSCPGTQHNIKKVVSNLQKREFSQST